MGVGIRIARAEEQRLETKDPGSRLATGPGIFARSSGYGLLVVVVGVGAVAGPEPLPPEPLAAAPPLLCGTFGMLAAEAQPAVMYTLVEA
jgi:hypothetical protein